MEYPQQKQSKILVIGETCIDRYVYGDCNRISPEAPVPVMNYSESIEKPGMAFNVFNNIMSLGQSADLITCDGKISKTRFIDRKSKQHILRLDQDDSCASMDISELDQLSLDDYTATVISDYDKGFLPNEMLVSLIHKLPKPIFVDTKKEDVGDYVGCFLKLNENEYKRAKNVELIDDMVITVGSKGALYRGQVYPVVPRDIVDVCGAGDTFIAALVVHYVQYFNAPEAIRFANLCASISVEKSGVYNVSLEEVIERNVTND